LRRRSPNKGRRARRARMRPRREASSRGWERQTRPLEHGLLSLHSVRTLLLGLTLALGLNGLAFGRQLVWLNGADGHGRPFDLRSLRGQVVALTFTSRYTKDEAHKINQALASRVDRDFAVVTVVDLVGVPSLFHGYAKRRIADEENRG